MRDVGKTDRMRAFFKNNPDEELTLKDFMVKFDINSPKTADSYLARLRDEGTIERVSVVRAKVVRK
jgi:hypothetical protein